MQDITHPGLAMLWLPRAQETACGPSPYGWPQRDSSRPIILAWEPADENRVCDDPPDDDDDDDFPPPEAMPRWWEEFGSDFDDDEPEPEPGDFWPEDDDREGLCQAGQRPP
jgi:hypothetical protein